MIQNIPKRADTDTARILQYLSSNPRSTLSELSEVVGIKRGTLGKIIVRLQDEGMLVREGSKRSSS